MNFEIPLWHIIGYLAGVAGCYVFDMIDGQTSHLWNWLCPAIAVAFIAVVKAFLYAV